MPIGDRPPEPLPPEEVRALLVACSDTLSGMRDHALLVMLWRGGLRIGEALALRPVDVDFGAGTVRILHTKTRQARTVGLDDQALEIVRAWLGVREAAGITDGPLFCRLHLRPGAPLSARYVAYQMVRLAERAGVHRRVHPHQMRHTMAVEWVREGEPVPRISRQLGHSSIATTQTYVDHLYPAEVIAVGRARTWA